MKTYFYIILAVTIGLSLPVKAETTLVYELVDAEGERTQQTYTFRARFVRVDKGSEAPENFLLLDGGFMYMNVVDGEKGTYTTFGESPFHQGKQMPAKPNADGAAATESAQTNTDAAKSPQPSVLSPTGQRETVAGVSCRIVNELRNEKPVAEHCLADPAALGMTPRELITMARLIEFSKQWTDPDWIAIQSDEQFITIRSRPAEGEEPTFVLKSVSHEISPRALFRVPPEYQKLAPEDDYTGLITGKRQPSD